MRPAHLVLSAALLLTACKPALCGPTAEARRDARSKVRRYPEVTGAELGESMSALEKAIAANPTGDKSGAFAFLTHAASRVRTQAAEMAKPSKGGEEAELLVSSFEQARSNLNTGLDEAARVCGE